MIRPLSLFVLAATAAQFTGCSGETAYKTMQATAHQQCMLLPPGEQADCESRVIKDDYESYNKKRGAESTP